MYCYLQAESVCFGGMFAFIILVFFFFFQSFISVGTFNWGRKEEKEK